MAFTINRQPDTYSPGYNELTFKVTSSNIAEPQMKYIFKTYVNGTLVSTNKIFPRPDGSCYFDAQPIVKNYLGSEIIDQSNEIINGQTGQSASFYVEFYEEYDIAGTITESPLRAISNTIVIFEMVAPYDETIANYIEKYDVDVITSGNPFAAPISFVCGPQKPASLSWSSNYSKPIQLKDTYEINSKESRIVSLIARNKTRSIVVSKMLVRVYCIDGTYKILSFNLPNSTDPAITYNMLNVNCGISALNSEIDSVILLPLNKNPYIDPNEDYAYSIEFYTSTSNFTHQPIIFRIVDEDCYQYEHITLMYKSQNGGYWYINTNMKNFANESIERFVYESKRQYTDTSTFRTNKVYNQNGSETLILTTDWLRSQADINEVKDLLESSNVYAILRNPSTGFYTNYVPVIMKTTSFAIKNLEQDKMTQYTFEVEKAFNKKYVI